MSARFLRMNINSLIQKSPTYKQCYTPKPLGKDGLLMQIHNTSLVNGKRYKIRFIYVNFNKEGHILAAADHAGNIFLIDFMKNKFWALPNIHSATIVKFSSYNNTELLVGTTNGKIIILNSETGEVTGELVGHQEGVTEISFSYDYMCLTATQNEAVIWDLRTNSKIQVLNIEAQSVLKHVMFMPITNNVLACFQEDTVLVWKYPSFEISKQISPTSLNKQTLKSIAFTRNGRAMVFSGHSSQLTIFALDTWSVESSIILPDTIQSVKKIDFIPQLFDGGCNRILAILTNNGMLHFYDLEQNMLISKISAGEEITKFDCSLDGKRIACILRSGEVNVYKVGCYVPSYSRLELNKSSLKSRSSTNLLTQRRSASCISLIQKQISEVLDKDKLRLILREFGQYPDSYRIKIWTQLLELPNNKQQYNMFINNTAQCSFGELLQEYPLENKIALKNLKKLLSNLTTWSPFFAEVRYIPLFVFPFVKVFQNEPVLCFEAICTIIINWCQHWFEYFPLPPMNILAMIENLLLEHEPLLLKHLMYHNITSKVYAWPILESAFSEILTKPDWCKLWDHILTNEPAFPLMIVTAYNILHKNAILKMNDQAQFEAFYRNQNVTDVKRLISKSYALLNNTSEQNHPQQYLDGFRKLEIGNYPSFQGFPKVLIDFEFSELHRLRNEKDKLKVQEEEIVREIQGDRQQKEMIQQHEEENERLKELEKACRQRITEERNRVKEQRKRLLNLRRQLHQEELDVLNKSREKIIEKNTKQRKHALQKILDEVEDNCAAEELEVVKAESDLIKHYSELLRHKIHLEEALNADPATVESSSEHHVLKKHQQLLAEELSKIQEKSKSKNYLKQLSVATGIAAMDDLILRIETELAHEVGNRYEDISKTHSNLKVLKLEAETKELEMEVGKLLSSLAELKSRETKEKLHNLRDTITTGKEQPAPADSHYFRQQRSHDYKHKVDRIAALTHDFDNLEKLIKQARDVKPTSAEIEGNQESLHSEELAVINLEPSSTVNN